MAIIRWLVRRPAVVILAGVLILLGGLAALSRMPVDLFPGLNYPLVNIVTHYPAGTAEDIELLITKPIENAVQGLNGLRRVRSISTIGFSQVTVEFTWGMDVLAARQLVSSALAQISGSLPPGANPQLENIGTSLAMVSTYTVSGESDPVSLRNWAQYDLAPALAGVPGVAQVQVMGGGRSAFRIDLEPARLLERHLSAEEVLAAVRTANVIGTGGFIEAYGRDLLVSTDGRIRSLKDLGQVLVGRNPDGAPVLLGDVALLYSGEMPERYVTTVNKAPSVAFTIQKQPDASTLEVSRLVEAKLSTLKAPAGARVAKFYDQSDIIGAAYKNMRNQLLLGALLAVLTLVWVLGWHRTTWIVAFSIPLSVIGAFILMRWAGFGLDLMTLGALTVTIGLINDDAVLVLENIFRHRQMERDSWRATLKGTREILGPDITGTFTVLAAFVPLVLLGGIAGRLFVPFGLTFSFVLLLSLGFSLTFIPWATARWLPPAGTPFRTSRTMGSRFIDWVTRQNRRVLAVLLRHRGITIIAALVLMGGSLALLAFNPMRFLPLLDEKSLLLSYQLAPGTSLYESDRVGDRLEQLALAQRGVMAVFRRTGSPERTFYVEAPSEGELVLRLDPQSGISALDVKKKLDAKLAVIPGLLTRINEPTTEKLDESFSGLPAFFGITIFGNDLAVLHAAANRVELAAHSVPGIGNVINNTKIPVDTLRIEIDRAACAIYGVSPAAVANALTIAVQGVEAGQSVIEGRLIHLFVRYALNARRRVADLDKILVPGINGAAVPLGQLAHIRQESSYAGIEHQFGSRALTITAEIGGNPYTVINRLNKAIDRLGLPRDIRVAYTGQYQQLIQTGREMLWILLASALLVFGIMTIQLGNLLDPAVVLLKLPIDFMGAALALVICRKELDVTVLIGFITLVGIAVNNGIVLLSFVQQLRNRGRDPITAVQEAVEVRIRPLMLTQLTAVLALVPAAIGLGKGPQLLQSLGIMLFGGLTVGTFLTLNLIPIFYVATERWRSKREEGC
jgi:CzcA family heavy metal efflux pump